MTFVLFPFVVRRFTPRLPEDRKAVGRNEASSVDGHQIPHDPRAAPTKISLFGRYRNVHADSPGIEDRRKTLCPIDVANKILKENIIVDYMVKSLFLSNNEAIFLYPFPYIFLFLL